MADTKHTVSVDFKANVKTFKQDVSSTFRSANKLAETSKKMQMSGIKGHKDLKKISDGIKKGDEKFYKKQIDYEKKLETQMSKTVKVMREKLKVANNDKKAIETEIKQLNRLQRVHEKLQQRRHASGVMSGKEKRSAFLNQSIGRSSGGGLNMLGMLGNVAMGGAMAIVGAAIGAVVSQVSSALEHKKAYGKAYSGLIGSGGSMAQLDRAVDKGYGLGYTSTETAQQAVAATRATGSVNAVTQAQALSRVVPMDVGEATGFMGTLARGGQSFSKGNSGKKALIETLAAGFHSGLERARMPEFIQSVGQLVETRSQSAAGDVSTSEVNRLLMAFGASGKSGLQGARGGSVLARLDEAIKNPGGGEAGEALMMQAFGFGRPGGTASYMDARRRMQQGIFGKGNAEALFSETERQYGGGKGQILALEKMTGLGQEQLEAIREVINSGATQEEQEKRLKALADQSKTIEEQALDSMKSGFSDTVLKMAELDRHFLDMGRRLEEPAWAIQQTLNEMIAAAMPAVVRSLEIIASVVQSIWNFLQQEWGGTDGAVGENTRKRVLREQEKSRLQYESGEISIGEYTNRLKKYQEELGSTHADLGRPGALKGLVEGIEHSGLKVVNSGAFGGPLARHALDAVGYNTNESWWDKRQMALKQVEAARSRIIRERVAANQAASEVLPNGQPASVVTTGTVPSGSTSTTTPASEQMNQLAQQNARTAAAVEGLARELRSSGAVTGNRPEGSPQVDSTGGVRR